MPMDSFFIRLSCILQVQVEVAGPWFENPGGFCLSYGFSWEPEIMGYYYSYLTHSARCQEYVNNVTDYQNPYLNA